MTDEKALAPMEAFQNKVREKLRADISDLIPDAMLDQMIAKAVEDMMGRTTDRFGRESKSWFNVMVEDHLKGTLSKRVQAWLAADEERLKERVSEAIVEAAPRMLAELLLGALQNASFEFGTMTFPRLLEQALRNRS